ncbi:hypothetical protein B6E66_27290 [Streptomyces maremycinicus]|nr:hypothetical protein B6E66_27290 [Streptomyces sp. B9173]
MGEGIGIGTGDAWPGDAGGAGEARGAAGRTGAVAADTGVGSCRRWTNGADGPDGAEGVAGAGGAMWAGAGTVGRPGAETGEGARVERGVGYGCATGRLAASPGVLRRNGTGAVTARRCTGAGDTADPGDTGDTKGLPVREAGWRGAPRGGVAVTWGSGAGRGCGVPVPVPVPVPWAGVVVGKGSRGPPGVAVLRCTTGIATGGSAEAAPPGPVAVRGVPSWEAIGMPLGAFSGTASAGRVERGAPSAGRVAAGRPGCAAAATGTAAR